MNTLPALRAALLAALLVLVPACSGLQNTRDRSQPDEPDEPETEPAGELPTPAANLADYEDFNVAPYREEAPAREAAGVQHDVPARLMESRAAEGVTRTVQGYRIQVFSSNSKADADAFVEEAIAWWDARPEETPALFPEELPVHTVYRQPYYRVRLGDFVSREKAEKALQYTKQHFPDAFLATGTVTVTEEGAAPEAQQHLPE